MIGEVELETLVLGLTEVAILAVVACTYNGESDEQVFRGVDVAFQTTIQFAVEEREVDTEVTGNRRFPLQVGISHGLRRSPVVVDSVHPRSGLVLVKLYELPHGDIVVTGCTVAQTELQVSQPVLGAFHKRLRRDTPCNSDRGEVTPAVALSELRGGIGTECSAHQILVLVVVVDTSEV